MVSDTVVFLTTTPKVYVKAWEAQAQKLVNE